MRGQISRYNQHEIAGRFGFMTTPFGYFDLLEAFAESGCAVCRLLQHDVEHFLDMLLYEHPTDSITQADFRASRGLCREHTWQLTRYNNTLAVAILYDQVLDEVMQIAAQTPSERQAAWARLLNSGSNPLADALAPQKPCCVCDIRDRAEGRYLQVIGEYVGEARMQAAFRQSDGLCLLHLRGALNLARDPRLLVEIQMTKWMELKGELELLLHKLDAHYHQEIGAESTSWLRTLARIAGEKSA
jgi:hypothetical protein